MSPWQAGRRRHSHIPGNAGLAALAGDAQARNRRLWASAGLAYVGAVALYVRGIPFRRGNVRTKKKKTRNKQNKLKSSQSTNLIYALYAHKNVKNCFATAPAPCSLLPAPPITYHTWQLCATLCLRLCPAFSLSLSPLCWTWTWAAERMRAYFALIGKRSHHQAGSTNGAPPTMTLNVQSTRI